MGNGGNGNLWQDMAAKIDLVSFVGGKFSDALSINLKGNMNIEINHTIILV